MATRRGLSLDDVLQSLGDLSDVDSENEDDIEDDLSWDESDNEPSNEESDVISEVSANESQSEDESEDDDSRDIRGKDGYVWSQKPKTVRRTPMRNIVRQKPGPKGNGCQADTPLKAFDLFFDDAMITEIVTWTNQKIENVKSSYKSNAGFVYRTSVIEIRALIGILLFLGATKSSKESTASIWAKDGTGKPICISAMSQKRFLFLVYCLRFDDSTTRAQQRANDKLAPVRNIYGKFVTACEANYTPGTGCTVDESLLAFRGRCSFKQYIPNKPSKYGIKIYVLADSKTFYSVSSRIYIGAGTHAPGLQVPTQAVLDLVPTISGTNRNITTDNYYTSIPLAKELKSRNLTLVGTMKKNKACIPPNFLAKAAEGTVQYAFDHANNFTLLSIVPKKNKRVVFLSTMHSQKKTDADTGKEEINVFYNQEKGGVDSHDQMCSFYTTARKTNRWPMRVFYGMVDSAALNAFVIFIENVPNFGERKKDKRQKFLKELALALITPHASQRLEVQQTPKDVKQVIRSCGIVPEAPTPAASTTQPHPGQRKRCYICPRSRDKKTKLVCNECNKFVCEEHTTRLCNQCQQ
jgi:hypothetical protein